MMRPPCGDCAFIMRNAPCMHRNMPSTLTRTTSRQLSKDKSSSSTGGPPMPALLKRTSSLPKAAFTFANNSSTCAGSPTSQDTTSASRPSARMSFAVSCNGSTRRPVTATSNLRLQARELRRGRCPSRRGDESEFTVGHALAPSSIILISAAAIDPDERLRAERFCCPPDRQEHTIS